MIKTAVVASIPQLDLLQVHEEDLEIITKMQSEHIRLHRALVSVRRILNNMHMYGGSANYANAFRAIENQVDPISDLLDLSWDESDSFDELTDWHNTFGVET